MSKQKPNPKKEDFDEDLPGKLAAARKALEDLVVAIRGGGSLAAAAAAAQAVLDGAEVKAPNFASDEAAELALKLNGEGKLSTAEIAAIVGSGADQSITVKDIEKATAGR